MQPTLGLFGLLCDVNVAAAPPPPPRVLVNSCLNQHTNAESFEKYKQEREKELPRDA